MIYFLHFLQFLNALASAGEFKSTDRLCQLINLAKHLDTCARRENFVNGRSECHLKIQGGYFGFCRISLNAEKDIVLPMHFCKGGALTRLYCSLAICDKVTRLNDVLLRCFLAIWRVGIVAS